MHVKAWVCSKPLTHAACGTTAQRGCRCLQGARKQLAPRHRLDVRRSRGVEWQNFRLNRTALEVQNLPQRSHVV